MKLVYISYGNIPSRWAHTFQMMRMVEAFSGLVDDATIVTQRHWSRFGMRFDYRSWYGLTRPVRVHHVYRRGVTRRRTFESWKSPGFAAHAVNYAKRVNADIVYTRLPEAVVECVAEGLPTILEHHGFFDVGEIESLVPIIDHPEFLGVVTINDQLKDHYIEVGFDGNRVLVWPDAVSIDRLESTIDRDWARSELGLSIDAKLAIYTGHLYDYKGIPELIEAARLRPGIEFVLVGGWPKDVERVREQVSELTNVRVVGFVENSAVPIYQAAADCLVLPNSLRNEHQAMVTSPLKLFEYMASRRPVVATRIPAMEGFLVDGENAIVVSPECSELLADAIESTINDHCLSREIVQKAFNQVCQITWQARAAAILDRFA